MDKSIVILILAVSLSFPSAAFSAGEQKAPAAKVEKPKVTSQVAAVKDKATPADMFDIEADKLDVYKTKGEAFFQGNVVATKPDMTIKSSTMRIYYNNATKQLKQMVAEGKVSIKMKDPEKGPDRNATCKQAIYQYEEKKIVLIGDVVIIRGQDKISGQKVILDIEGDRQQVESSPGTRVKITGNLNKDSSTGAAVPW
jgi:lipopolysaccharide export system protein LptA